MLPIAHADCNLFAATKKAEGANVVKEVLDLTVKLQVDSQAISIQCVARIK